jgi:hypothetical protein
VTGQRNEVCLYTIFLFQFSCYSPLPVQVLSLAPSFQIKFTMSFSQREGPIFTFVQYKRQNYSFVYSDLQVSRWETGKYIFQDKFNAFSGCVNMIWTCNSVAFSPQANYTDRATAAYQQS